MLLAEAIASSSELAAGKVKHIRNALILAFGVELDGAPAATPAGADARVVGEVKPALERLVPQTAGKGLPGA